jgi:hypothetical protein
MALRIRSPGPGWGRRASGLVPAVLLGAALLPAGQGVCRADDCKHCPPPYYHCQEAPPCIKFKHACPRPVCPPCDLDFFGYYPTCWRIWPAGQANCPATQPPWVPVPPSFATPANPFGMRAMNGTLGLPGGEGTGTELAPLPRTTVPATPAPADPGRPRLESSQWQPTTRPQLETNKPTTPTLSLENDAPEVPAPGQPQLR